MGQYKQYTEEFKRDVLAMVAEGKRSIAQIERDLYLTTGLMLGGIGSLSGAALYVFKPNRTGEVGK